MSDDIQPMNMLAAAQEFRVAGLCPLPARRATKRPAIDSWKPYQSALPSENELQVWFSGVSEAICVVTGTVSGNLEMIDFDCGGDRFEAWCSLVPPELLSRLVIARSQSSGKHVIYRCGGPVNGNMKLAMRERDTDVVTLIETRGEGGLFLCAPTPGYSVEQGSLCDPPLITPAERESLLEAAWSLNEYVPPPVVGGTSGAAAATFLSTRPGDDFNARGDVREILHRHGWALAKGGENEYWRRPGKTHGWSATMKAGVFYVFSSNAAPFEPNKSYSPFAVLALLDHGGDYATAASALRKQGFGGDDRVAVGDGAAIAANLLAAPGAAAVVVVAVATEPAGPPAPLIPQPLDESLLRVPGFVGEVMDHCLATAPYPNPVMAFCGAMALQAFLASRKVRDTGDNRTNLYLLGLAHSAAGKDWPRKLNNRILYEAGLSGCLGERFASGEGIQDALSLEPAMLFQTDEIDGLLQSIGKSRDARFESIVTMLLTLYSSANTVLPIRRKAGKEPPGAIDQPSLTIFGTAIPNHYYEALSPRMLTNGLFARMLILECGQRGVGQEPKVAPLPPRVLDTAQWWAAFKPGGGNLATWHPVPAEVGYTLEAQQAVVEARIAADEAYREAESRNDPVATTVWGRVNEQIRKLALVYAVSESPRNPLISLAATKWAEAFVTHQTRRMLHMAAMHSSESDFEQKCKRVIAYMRETNVSQTGGGWVDYRDITRKFRWSRRDHDDLRNSLIDQELIEVVTVATGGRPRMVYRLRGGQ